MRERNVMAWLVLAGAVLLEVTATLSIKAALEQPALYAVVVLGYAGAFTCLTLVLRRGMPLGVAYGIWAASGVALTAMLSSVIFHEPVTVLMGIGLALIMGGVLCVEIGAQKAHTQDEEAA